MLNLRRFWASDRAYWTLLLAPALIVLAVMFIYPLIYSFYLSLTAYDIILPPKFVGVRNYVRILSDPQVWNSVRVPEVTGITVAPINRMRKTFSC